MSKKEEVYLLIAGAWHNGWYWQNVQTELEANGHKVMAVDLPGHGQNNMPLAEQNLESYAQYVLGIIAKQTKPVILVGHSMAGAVACQAAEYIPEKVSKLVVLCGFLLQDGESVNGLNNGIRPADWRKIGEIGLGNLSPDQKVTYINEAAARKNFYGDLPEGEAILAAAHLNGEAIAAQWQAVRLGNNFASIDKIYIKTLNDAMLSLELQDKMSQRNVQRVYSINSGHSPFLTAPQKLAEILLDIPNCKRQKMN